MQRRRGVRLTKGIRRELKRRFLARYAMLGCVAYACHDVGISRATFYNWLRLDEQFRKRYDELRDTLFQQEMEANERMYAARPSLEQYLQTLSDRAVFRRFQTMMKRRQGIAL